MSVGGEWRRVEGIGGIGGERERRRKSSKVDVSGENSEEQEICSNEAEVPTQT